MEGQKHLAFDSLRQYMSKTFMGIPDNRQDAKVNYSLHDTMMSGFACMHFQDPSLLQFQKRLSDQQNKNNLETLFGVKNIPKNSQLRETIDAVDSQYLRPIFKNFYSRLQRSKHLEQFQLFPGRYYFPIDGSQFYSSKDIHCEQCLTKKHGDETTTYSHQVLQGGIMHPDCSEVIPFMPEQICNTDGATKQDCEMNAAKRFISNAREEFPRLGFVIGGDSLFSRQPLIELVLQKRMNYIFVAKPTDHTYLMDYIDAYKNIPTITFEDEKGRTHIYEWVNDVPLNGREDAVQTNFFRCRIIGVNKKGVEKIVYKNSWVTDLSISDTNIKTLVQAGRCRWKAENEVFNTMKNHGYCMERNYGHGAKNLAFNFYILTLLAFFMHQIFELTDKTYQKCRVKFGSKKHFWETLRAYIKIIVFESWDKLLAFALKPTRYVLATPAAP